MVGYEGGHVEKDLLMKLNIPCLNLETLGCPKCDKLTHIIPQEKLLPSCGFHADDTVHHFPIPECHAFWYWYKCFIANHAQRVIKNSFFIFNSARLLTFGGTETFLSPERCAYLKEGD